MPPAKCLRRGKLVLISILILSTSLLLAGLALAQYRWVDDQGSIHYSQTLNDIPERYRSQATIISPSSPSSPNRPSSESTGATPFASPPTSKTPTSASDTKAGAGLAVASTDPDVLLGTRLLTEHLNIAIANQRTCATLHLYTTPEDVFRAYGNAEKAQGKAREKLDTWLDQEIGTRQDAQAKKQYYQAKKEAKQTVQGLESMLQGEIHAETSNIGARAACIAKFEQEERSIWDILRVAATDPETFGGAVRRAHQMVRDRILLESRVLYEAARNLSDMLTANAIDNERLYKAAEASKIQVQTIRSRYKVALEQPAYQAILNPVLAASDAILAVVDARRLEQWRGGQDPKRRAALWEQAQRLLDQASSAVQGSQQGTLSSSQ